MDNSTREFIFSIKDDLILFHLLDEEEVAQIVDHFDSALYRKGTVVFNEGDAGDFIGFIISGLLEVKKQTEFEGRQIVIATLKKGSCVGEMSLINPHERRFATVVALEDTELVILKRDALDSLIHKYPRIGIKILKGLNQVLAIRLRRTVERLTSIF